MIRRIIFLFLFIKDRACGEGELADYPYIYFVTPQVDYLWRTTCVKECPATKNELKFECANNTVVVDCARNESTVVEEQILIYDSEPCKNKSN